MKRLHSLKGIGVNTYAIKAWRAKAAGALARRAAAQAALVAARSTVNAAEMAWVDADHAQQIVQAVAETVQEEAHQRISGVVTRCLAAVFEEPYEFQIQFERVRGRTEAKLLFVRDGQAIPPIDSAGGGVVDVAAFALRISCLMLARPACRRLVVLDEPFRFVSAGYRGRVRAMLEGLQKELGVQIIMVTHIEELQCGHVVAVGE